MKSSFKCIQCGKCCKEIPIDVTRSDIVRWYNSGRWDILREVSYINNYPKVGLGGFFIAITTFNPKRDCPFLKDGKCAIHDTKPMVCNHAPIGHKEFAVCPVFNLNNISNKNRKLVKSIQKIEFDNTYFNKEYLFSLLVEVRKNE